MKNTIAKLNIIVQSLYNSDLSIIDNDNILLINNITSDILSSKVHTVDQITAMGLIVKISNILYNNTDRLILPLEDGVYDLLLELYKNYNPNYQIGAEPISFETSKNISIVDNAREQQPLVRPVVVIDRNKVEDSLFINDEELTSRPVLDYRDYLISPLVYGDNITKAVRDTAHVYPNLVGTLDKCKFVLNSQARDRGVFDDDNVKIFERDFIQKHLAMGIISPTEEFEMVLELKYDGISIEAEVSDKIISARTRGDANNNVATDLTPVLGGYKFRHMPIADEVIGMKFEAIITNDNLYRLGILRDKEYKNCRNAVTGILGSTDAILYRDFITLIPLASSIGGDRVVDIEFCNTYYHSGELLRYAVVKGDYKEILFYVNRFVEEAEYMREFLPFMYDGVVVSYRDEDKVKALGRENSVNKYSIAIKFNAMQKLTTFIGYTYSVGQNGVITPVAYYNPVEFYGTIHNKTTIHSYARFMELGLRLGDIVCIEYTNDVIPYLTKPDNSSNAGNINPVIPFITECPSCGTPLKLTSTGKGMYCDNLACPERNISRMTNMLQKLNLKDFSEESLKSVAKYSLRELFNLTLKDVEILGPNDSMTFLERLESIKTNPIYDYKIVGSLGFSGIAVEKWKLIFNKLSISDIICMDEASLIEAMVSIKGIGRRAAETVCAEREFFMDDLIYISNMQNVMPSIDIGNKLSIRFSGVRDSELVDKLQAMNIDANPDAGVTKFTNILIIPFDGYESVKTQKAGPDTMIVSISNFKDNIDLYVR